MERIIIKNLLSCPPADGAVVTVCGWAKTVRDSKNIGFIELSDGSAFKNLQVVFEAGKLENYTRDGIQMKLLSLGARPASSVSKKTDYLIVGENAGSKLTKAQTLGVTTLTELQFLQMLADAGIEA